MTHKASHPDEALFRYVEGTLTDTERRDIDEHLKGCEECRGQLAFTEKLRHGLGELSEEEFTTDEPCPDSWTLVSYEAGDIDEETARHLRAHLLFCDQCAVEFYVLRRVARQESWQARVERLKESIIDLAKSYGPGALVGPIRIAAEQPAFATRGTERLEGVSKVLEVNIGENNYSIELKLTKEGLACDCGGFRATLKAPLSISVHSGSSEELISTQSDEFGNCHFVIPAGAAPDGLYVFTLVLKDAEQQFLFRVPEGNPPA